MGNITIEFNKQHYHLSCKDEEEEHIKGLAASLNERGLDLVSKMGKVSDTRLLLMLGIILSDELNQAKASPEGSGEAVKTAQEINLEWVKSMDHAIDKAIEKIDGITKELEAAS